MIKVILTSDDFGLSKVFNEKIIEMLELHFLTSVSVMPKRIMSEQTLQIQKLINICNNSEVSLGLHLELSNIDCIKEIEEQWALFLNIFKCNPDYIDLHKGGKFKGNFNDIAKFCNLKNIPFRKYPQTSIDVKQPAYSITTTSLNIGEIKNIIDDFEDNQIYEIVFHIGSFDENSKSVLNKDRELDIEKLKQTYDYLKLKNIDFVNYNCTKSLPFRTAKHRI